MSKSRRASREKFGPYKAGGKGWNYTPPIATCNRCQKRSYASKADAKRIARAWHTDHVGPYHCPVSTFWHIGHLSPEVINGNASRGEVYG